MEKLKFYGITRNDIQEKPVWSSIQILKEFNNVNNLETNSLYDYEIQVIQMDRTLFEQRQYKYWIRYNIFLKSLPNHTFTLFTVYCSEINVFPVWIDSVCFPDLEEMMEFENKETLIAKLRDIYSLSFNRITNSISNYSQHKQNNHMKKVKEHIKTVEHEDSKTEETYKPKRGRGKLWTSEEDEIFINIMDVYRSSIESKAPEEIKDITRKYAFKLKEKHEILRNRAEQRIYDRISYFDDLLAGIGSKDEYYQKDIEYYGSRIRSNKNNRSNPARGKHNRANAKKSNN